MTVEVLPGSIHVIIPVRDMAEQAALCLAALVGQCSEIDRITVVDDGSTDHIAAVARAAGVELLRVTGAGGPYAARHASASRTGSEYLLFIDARCRALPGLVESHRALLAGPDVALSCTGVRTRLGPSFAARVAALQQPFALSGKVGIPGQLDFFPSANLGVRASAYRRVGGFRGMRSGADADLCWRIQLAGLGRFGVDEAVLMEWEPRSSWSDLRRQWARYGESTAHLEYLFPGQSPAGASSEHRLAAGARRLLARIGTTPTRDLGVLAGSLSVHATYLGAVRRARKVVGQLPAPESFPDLDALVWNERTILEAERR